MSKMVDVEAKIKWETENAWKVSNEKVEEVWLPKVIKGEEVECDEGDNGWAVFTIPAWLAAEKGLV
jgi:hypothetical protein